MRRGSRRLRGFALIWAVLQFALPASATLVDARIAAASPDRAHVEDAPGRDCAPSHSPDCGICKHLSTSSLGPGPLAGTLVDDGREQAFSGRLATPARTLAGASLPRAPPSQG